jgi:hypothetical protein
MCPCWSTCPQHCSAFSLTTLSFGTLSRLAFLDNFNFDFLLDDGLKAILVERSDHRRRC